jgi:hypothetical protein
MGFAGSLAMALFPLACAGPSGRSGGAGGSSGGSGGGSGSGGASGSGGTSSLGGAGGANSLGGASGSGGVTSSGGSGQPDAPIASGGSGGTTNAGGGTSSSGGMSSTGGSVSKGGAGGAGGVSATGGSAGGGTSAPRSSGGAGGSGGTMGGSGGTAGTSSGAGGTTGTGGTSTTPWTTLPPPRQCGNKFATQDEGCVTGQASSTCGGNCTSFVNACQDTLASKPNMPVAFICPQWMLFSDVMRQAADLDGNTAFNYAIVGHDPDTNGIDSGAHSCCQCYQLVYDYPSDRDTQARANPDDPNNTQSGIQPLPPPLIVQTFDLGATTDSFDVFMAAGGFGANNACDPNSPQTDSSGKYLYTSFPPDGADNGGVKGATKYSECKTAVSWVTTATLSSAACQSKIQTECNMFKAPSATLADTSIRSCIQSNNPQTYYHLNWFVYAMKVECPTHLTDLTGCKLAPQGLPAVNPNVTTAAQAAANSSFRSKAGNGNRLWTSTMEDCCMPSCAFRDNVTGNKLTATGLYNSFYSCDQNGVPYTQ